MEAVTGKRDRTTGTGADGKGASKDTGGVQVNPGGKSKGMGFKWKSLIGKGTKHKNTGRSEVETGTGLNRGAHKQATRNSDNTLRVELDYNSGISQQTMLYVNYEERRGDRRKSGLG